MTTINDRIELTSGRSTGFDYLRISLAFIIFSFHSVLTSYGLAAQNQIWEGPFHACLSMLLPMFFALSGFLVAGSLERSRTILQFLGLRAIRIFPALACETIVSAFAFGLIVTQLSLVQYFSSPVFLSYLKNVLGIVNFELPGVFYDNPMPRMVNGQLWTVPFELECYALLGILALVGLVKHRSLLLAFTTMLQIIAIVKFVINGRIGQISEYWHGGLSGHELTVTFLYGTLIYVFKEKLQWGPQNAMVSLATAIALLSTQSNVGDMLSAPFVAYVTVYLGLTNFRKYSILKSGDLSYGIFLYGFAVEQFVVQLGARTWWQTLLCGGPLVLAISWLSWNLIEKPALSLRRYLSLIDPTAGLQANFRTHVLDHLPSSAARRL